MMWTTRQRSDLAQLRVISAGSGPAVLLIHGVGLCADTWNPQIDALAEEFSVTAVDMPGHGTSQRLPPDADLTAYTETIAACLTDKTVVVGHSMGAMIALNLAARHPDKISGVAALNAIFQRTPDAQTAVRARAQSLDGHSMADPLATLSRWFGDVPSPAREACHRWLTCVDPQGYRTAYRVFADEDGPTEQTLKTLRCPALFVTGSDEPNSTPAMSHAMANLTPNGRAHIIEGAAHMMPMTHSEKLNAHLLHFARYCTQ
ncbi:MAG: alpha/beta hydrolase [Sulfitobacter sp.]